MTPIQTARQSLLQELDDIFENCRSISCTRLQIAIEALIDAKIEEFSGGGSRDSSPGPETSVPGNSPDRSEAEKSGRPNIEFGEVGVGNNAEPSSRPN